MITADHSEFPNRPLQPVLDTPEAGKWWERTETSGSGPGWRRPGAAGEDALHSTEGDRPAAFGK